MASGAADRPFVDTNVLVYANALRSPWHAAALEALDRAYNAGTELWISRQVLREYLAVVTRDQVWASPLPVATAARRVRTFERTFEVAEDGPAVTRRLLQLMRRIPLAGRQVHDANIVATMLVHSVPVLLTFNASDFARYAGLIAVQTPAVP